MPSPQASDFKGVATNYARDAQGNAMSESQRRHRQPQHPVRRPGPAQRIVDALGQATQISRDALGRPTA